VLTAFHSYYLFTAFFYSLWQFRTELPTFLPVLQPGSKLTV